jgi:hypothetical protein
MKIQPHCLKDLHQAIKLQPQLKQQKRAQVKAQEQGQGQVK